MSRGPAILGIPDVTVFDQQMAAFLFSHHIKSIENSVGDAPVMAIRIKWPFLIHRIVTTSMRHLEEQMKDTKS